MKKEVRKVCTLVLACIVIMAAVAGCGSGSAATSQTTGTSSETKAAESTAAASEGNAEKIVLKVLSFSTDRVDMFKQVNTDYQKTHPNVEIMFDAKDSSQYFTILATQIQSGEAPDLFATLGISSSNLADLVNQGCVLPMDEHADLSIYPDWLKKIYTVNGKIYAIPGLVEDSFAVFYNKKVFDQYGLSAPKTQGDIDTISQTLIKNGVTPFVLPGKDSFAILMELDLFAQSYAAQWNTDWPYNGKKFSDPEFLNAVKLFASWIDKGYFGKDYRSLDKNAAIIQLIQGKAAMFMQGAWDSAAYKDSPDIHTFQLKRPDGKDAGITSPKQDTGLSVYAKSKNIDAAVEFAKYFGTPEVQQLIANLGGSVPSTGISIAKDITSPDPLLTEIMQKDHSEMAFADTSGFIPLKGVDFFSAMCTNVQKLVFKQITPEQLVEEFDKVLDFSAVQK